jgi:putative membrane protein insertion efficiency factor
VKSAALLLIRGYQRLLSPGLGAVCRYEPSCSRYAYEAVERFGTVRGGWLALQRLSRCHPWHAGGFDPVPADFEASATTQTTAPQHSTLRRS